jgi:hypothetical protein
LALKDASSRPWDDPLICCRCGGSTGCDLVIRHRHDDPPSHLGGGEKGSLSSSAPDGCRLHAVRTVRDSRTFSLSLPYPTFPLSSGSPVSNGTNGSSFLNCPLKRNLICMEWLFCRNTSNLLSFS